MSSKRTVTVTSRLGAAMEKNFDTTKLVLAKRLKSAEKSVLACVTRAEEQEGVVEYITARSVVTPSATWDRLQVSESVRLGNNLRSIDSAERRARSLRFLDGQMTKNSTVSIPEGAPAELILALCGLAKRGLNAKQYKAAKRELYAKYMPDAKSGAHGETATPVKPVDVNDPAEALVGAV